jgi:cytochrome c oxidase cbb3-type subunit IV
VKRPQQNKTKKTVTDMYKNVLQNIDNVAVWPVISFVIFFVFFICLVWWVLTTDKKFINTMKSMPLDNKPAKKKSTIKTQTGTEQ